MSTFSYDIRARVKGGKEEFHEGDIEIYSAVQESSF